MKSLDYFTPKNIYEFLIGVFFGGAANGEIVLARESISFQ